MAAAAALQRQRRQHSALTDVEQHKGRGPVVGHHHPPLAIQLLQLLGAKVRRQRRVRRLLAAATAPCCGCGRGSRGACVAGSEGAVVRQVQVQVQCSQSWRIPPAAAPTTCAAAAVAWRGSAAPTKALLGAKRQRGGGAGVGHHARVSPGRLGAGKEGVPAVASGERHLWGPAEGGGEAPCSEWTDRLRSRSPALHHGELPRHVALPELGFLDCMHGRGMGGVTAATEVVGAGQRGGAGSTTHCTQCRHSGALKARPG